MINRQLNNVVVIGGRIMGVGISQNFAQAGLAVKLLDINIKEKYLRRF